MASPIRGALRWLSRQWPSWDTWLLLITSIYWIYRRQLTSADCFGVVNPWYCDWAWYCCANRLLLAALCLRSRRSWLEIIGFVTAAHVLAGQLFYFVNTDEFSQMALTAREIGIVRAVVQHQLLQGAIAVLIAPLALIRFMRGLSRRSPLRLVTTAIKLGMLALLLGYLSDFLSHGAAETATARWVYQDVLKRSTLYGRFSNADYLNESAGRFISVGATVLTLDSSQFLMIAPFAEVGPSSFTGPFLISVQYQWVLKTSASPDVRSGTCLVLNLFGFVRVVDRDSLLWRRLIAYLWPY